MFDIFKRRRTIIMDEQDVTRVLNIINKYIIVTCDQGLFVQECGWNELPEKWFILFYSTKKQWESISQEIKKIPSVDVE